MCVHACMLCVCVCDVCCVCVCVCMCVSYRGYSWISKYHISIFIVFIVFTYVKVNYSLDMNSRVTL